MNEPENQAQNPSQASSPPASIRSVPSEDLLKGERQVLILHNGEAYRLLVTRNDKLLLQK
jgi:hemin uptake protein HemP